jgi:hypothetical protein
VRRFVLPILAVLLLAPSQAAAQKRGAVLQTIDRMELAGQIDALTADEWESDWRAARRGARRLSGAEKVHLRGVLKNTISFARRRALAARAPIAMLTVKRNADYFWRDRKKVVAINTRTTFEDSPIVFQLYAGSGWQVQPLGNLGTLNALSKRRRISARTRAWAEELLALTVRRNGAIAIEHMFPWAGGRPGWVSTMPQAVAVEAYTRLGYREEAQQMLEVLRQPPPSGVRLDLGGEGDHLLQYSQAPEMLVGNSFAQALLSLHAYVGLAADDPIGREVYDRAMLQARTALTRYDTGSWSLYYHRPGTTEGQESDLHYHQLFEQFLGQLCERIGGEPFCTMHANFARYETEPVGLGPMKIRASRTEIVGQALMSKRGSVTATLYRDDDPVQTLRFLGSRGTLRVRFARPKRAGRYRIDVTVTSLNNLRSSITAERELARPPKPRRR